MQIPVHEVDLLQAAKALADVLRAHVPDAVHGFELRVRRGEDLVQSRELVHDLLDHQLRQAWDAPEDAVALWRYGMVERVLAVLRDDMSAMPKNWNRRFKHNRDKMKTGDVFELAEVVRNLAIRETEKGLSTGEKQMYTRAKKILASELMYALEMEEGEAEEHLEELIKDAHAERTGDAATA